MQVHNKSGYSFSLYPLFLFVSVLLTAGKQLFPLLVYILLRGLDRPLVAGLKQCLKRPCSFINSVTGSFFFGM